MQCVHYLNCPFQEQTMMKWNSLPEPALFNWSQRKITDSWKVFPRICLYHPRWRWTMSSSQQTYYTFCPLLPFFFIPAYITFLLYRQSILSAENDHFLTYSEDALTLVKVFQTYSFQLHQMCWQQEQTVHLLANVCLTCTIKIMNIMLLICMGS